MRFSNGRRKLELCLERECKSEKNCHCYLTHGSHVVNGCRKFISSAVACLPARKKDEKVLSSHKIRMQRAVGGAAEIGKGGFGFLLLTRCRHESCPASVHFEVDEGTSLSLTRHKSSKVGL